MSTSAVRRLVEAFFRRWPFYAVLFVVALIIGVTSAARTPSEYTSSGAIFVDNQSLVTTQSGVQDGSFFSYLSPASFTSQELDGLLYTDVFMEGVVTRAGVQLPENAVAKSELIGELRQAVSTFPESENLVRLVVTTGNPELSFRMASSIIDEFVQFQISVDVAESGASEEFFVQLVEDYEADLEEARDAVDNALRGVTDLAEASPRQEAQIGRLRDAENLAESRFQSAASNLEASRLARAQTETDVRQSYSIFDPPQLPTQPNSGFQDSLTLIAMFAVLGIILTLLGPLFAAFFSRTILFPEDLDPETTPRVVAKLPKVSRRLTRVSGARTPVAEAGADEVSQVERDATRTISFTPVGSSGVVGAEVPPEVKPPVSAPVAEEAAAPEPQVDQDAEQPVDAVPAPEPRPAPEPQPVAAPSAEAEADEPSEDVVDAATATMPVADEEVAEALAEIAQEPMVADEPVVAEAPAQENAVFDLSVIELADLAGGGDGAFSVKEKGNGDDTKAEAAGVNGEGRTGA